MDLKCSLLCICEEGLPREKLLEKKRHKLNPGKDEMVANPGFTHLSSPLSHFFFYSSH